MFIFSWAYGITVGMDWILVPERTSAVAAVHRFARTNTTVCTFAMKSNQV